MANLNKFYIDKFRGGMATDYSNDNIGPTNDNPLEEFPIIDNWDFSTRGAFEKRPGFTNILISNQDLLNLGLLQTTIDDNNFDDSIYDDTFDAYFKFEAKGFYEQSDGSYDPAEPEDDAYDIRLGMMDGNLVTLNFIDSLEDGSALYTVFPTRIILGSLNSGINMESVQFGNELYLATADGIYIIRLIRRYIDGSDWSEYELEARRLDSEDEIYYPDGNEYQTIGNNLYIPDNEIVTAGSFVIGERYTITTIGTTDFTLIGAASNTVGKQFIATGVGSGTGTATLYFSVTDDLNSSDPLLIKFIKTNLNKGIVNSHFQIRPIFVTTTATVEELYHKIIITDPDNVEVLNVERIPPANPLYSFKPSKIGIYTIYWAFKVLVTDSYDTEYTIQYEVVATGEDVASSSLNYEINKCSRLFVYYNRLIVYSNGTGKWYKSDIDRPAYFTLFGVSDFASINRESLVENLQSVTPYRNSLIVLSEKSMFLTTGKGDDYEDILGVFEPFNSVRISDKGTIAPYSVAKNENNLIFLSNDGIYVLDAIYVDEKKANIYKISDKINSLALKNEVTACGIVFENKYYLNFPSSNYTLKWDYIFGQQVENRVIPSAAWSRDISTELIFTNIKVIDNDLYCLIGAADATSKLLKLNKKDNGLIYREILTSILSGEAYDQLFNNGSSLIFWALDSGSSIVDNYIKIIHDSVTPTSYAERHTILAEDTQYTLMYKIYFQDSTGAVLWLYSGPFDNEFLEGEPGIYSKLLTSKETITDNYVKFRTYLGVNGQFMGFRAVLFAGDLTGLSDGEKEILIENAEFGVYQPSYTYSGTVAEVPIEENSITFYLKDAVGEYEVIDDGNGNILVAGRLLSGTINYTSGVYELIVSTELTIDIRTEYDFDFEFESNSYPTNWFADDETVFQALLETKAYKFIEKSRMKKVKQIILELSAGNYTLLYSANERKIIDAQQVPTVIFTITDGRVVSYSGVLETNIDIEGNFILGDSDRGILGVNLLGSIEEQYVYFSIRKSSFAQRHKLVIAHSEDSYAKILGFGFKYIYGKDPR